MTLILRAIRNLPGLVTITAILWLVIVVAAVSTS